MGSFEVPAYNLLEGKAELSWCFKQAALHWNEWVNTIWVSF
jgi:hypothetical protein